MKSDVMCACCGTVEEDVGGVDDGGLGWNVCAFKCNGCGCGAEMLLRWSDADRRWLVIEWSLAPEQMNVRGPDADRYLAMLVPNALVDTQDRTHDDRDVVGPGFMIKGKERVV